MGDSRDARNKGQPTRQYTAPWVSAGAIHPDRFTLRSSLISFTRRLNSILAPSRRPRTAKEQGLGRLGARNSRLQLCARVPEHHAPGATQSSLLQGLAHHPSTRSPAPLRGPPRPRRRTADAGTPARPRDRPPSLRECDVARWITRIHTQRPRVRRARSLRLAHLA